MANLDTDGDGDSDPADYAAALKLTDGERTTLAPLYAPGDELFRVPIPHLVAVGPQLAVRVPARRAAPADRPGRKADPRVPGGGELDDRLREPDADRGRRRRRHAAIDLSYSSDWEPGGASRSFDVGDDAGDAARRPPRRRAQGAGRGRADRPALRRSRRLPGLRHPADHAGHRRRTITWDGLDAFGEPVAGAVKAHADPELLLPAVPVRNAGGASTAPGPRSRERRSSEDERFGGRQGCTDLSAFDVDSSTAISAPSGCRPRRRATVGSAGRADTGLGGWDLDSHHVYDAQAGAVRLGDGTVRRSGEIDVGRMTDRRGAGSGRLERRRHRARPRRGAAGRLGAHRRLAGHLPNAGRRGDRADRGHHRLELLALTMRRPRRAR